MTIFTRLFKLLDPRDRAKAAGLVGLLVLNGILEVIGIGLIFPYVALLQSPERIHSFSLIDWIYQTLGFQQEKSFLIFVSFGLLGIFVFKAVFILWLNNIQLRFNYGLQEKLGTRLFSSYVYQPYSRFLDSNTSTLIGNLTTSLTQLCTGVLQSCFMLATEAAIALGVVGLLIYVNPLYSLAAGICVTILACMFLTVVKNRIAVLAQENDQRWKGMIRAVNEGLSGIKEIQVLGREQEFINVYTEECRQLSLNIRKFSFLTQCPRVFLETSAIAGMVLFAVFALIGSGNQEELFPMLAVFAVATVRVVPSANRMIQAWNSISFLAPSIGVVEAGLRQASAIPVVSDIVSRPPPADLISIAIKSFKYSPHSRFELRDVELQIARGETIGIIGHSGSGKTTIVDLLLGLFTEYEGAIQADGCDIRTDMRAWRAGIGYIPQSIYLCDATIGENVAFGISRDRIDPVEVERAVRLAGLDRVIARQPEGSDTMVGDRGIRLSGGERQRIGIARALYHDPSLLILDEATSALDNQTERRIIDSILGAASGKTIIVIAHRLSTVKNCDRVYLMQEGRILDCGTFEELANRHPQFVNPQEPVLQR